MDSVVAHSTPHGDVKEDTLKMNNLGKALQIILRKEDFTQDIKKIFFNEAVFNALSQAMDAHIGENRVDIARALWFVAGKLDRLGEVEPIECTNCEEKDRCTEDYCPCKGRPALYFGNEDELIEAYKLLKTRQ